jgi:hypothetical protein
MFLKPVFSILAAVMDRFIAKTFGRKNHMEDVLFCSVQNTCSYVFNKKYFAGQKLK